VFRASGGGYPVYAYGRGDMGRLPTYENLDLVLTQEFRLGGSKRLSFQANFDNVLDLKNINSYYYDSYGNNLFHQSGRYNVALPITYFYTPYNVETAAKQYTAPTSQGGSGGTLWDNAFYGTSGPVPGPWQIRVSAKFSF
jgi:hypothetical protein